MNLDHAIERLYALKVDTTTRDGDGTPHEKPHKPLLLLAALDLIDEGLATPDHIPWCQALRDRFTARFEVVRKLNDRNNPDLPFRYLAGDDLWIALEADGKTPVRREIRVSDIGHVFARFTNNTQRSRFPPSAPRRYVHSKNLRALASWRFKIPIPATITA